MGSTGLLVLQFISVVIGSFTIGLLGVFYGTGGTPAWVQFFVSMAWILFLISLTSIIVSYIIQNKNKKMPTILTLMDAICRLIVGLLLLIAAIIWFVNFEYERRNLGGSGGLPLPFVIGAFGVIYGILNLGIGAFLAYNFLSQRKAASAIGSYYGPTRQKF